MMAKMHGRRLWGAALIFMMLAAGMAAEESPSPGQVKDKSRFSIGAGFGIPFGTFGFNLEFNPIVSRGRDAISEYYSLNVGLGFALVGIGYSFGFRFYPLGRHSVLQPKVAAYYGVVGISNWNYCFRGFALGVGSQAKLYKRLYLDGEVIFVLYAFGYDISDVGRLKVSAGLRLDLD